MYLKKHIFEDHRISAQWYCADWIMQFVSLLQTTTWRNIKKNIYEDEKKKNERTAAAATVKRMKTIGKPLKFTTVSTNINWNGQKKRRASLEQASEQMEAMKINDANK